MQQAKHLGASPLALGLALNPATQQSGSKQQQQQQHQAAAASKERNPHTRPRRISCRTHQPFLARSLSSPCARRAVTLSLRVQ
jgi:hypothetical protein